MIWRPWSLDQLYIVSCYIKRVKTSWTYSRFVKLMTPPLKKTKKTLAEKPYKSNSFQEGREEGRLQDVECADVCYVMRLVIRQWKKSKLSINQSRIEETSKKEQWRIQEGGDKEGVILFPEMANKGEKWEKKGERGEIFYISLGCRREPDFWIRTWKGEKNTIMKERLILFIDF